MRSGAGPAVARVGLVRAVTDAMADSSRNTNCGLARIASSADVMPASKLRPLRPSSKNVISRSRSCSVGRRRNAPVASASTIRLAHGRSSSCAVGRHTKILRRLTVSETPVTRCGPAMLRSFRCGSVVTP
jgi:hypothetical protein